jgi:hypothetical protein
MKTGFPLKAWQLVSKSYESWQRRQRLKHPFCRETHKFFKILPAFPGVSNQIFHTLVLHIGIPHWKNIGRHIGIPHWKNIGRHIGIPHWKNIGIPHWKNIGRHIGIPHWKNINCEYHRYEPLTQVNPPICKAVGFFGGFYEGE